MNNKNLVVILLIVAVAIMIFNFGGVGNRLFAIQTIGENTIVIADDLDSFYVGEEQSCNIELSTNDNIIESNGFDCPDKCSQSNQCPSEYDYCAVCTKKVLPPACPIKYGNTNICRADLTDVVINKNIANFKIVGDDPATEKIEGITISPLPSPIGIGGGVRVDFSIIGAGEGKPIMIEMEPRTKGSLPIGAMPQAVISSEFPVCDVSYQEFVRVVFPEGIPLGEKKDIVLFSPVGGTFIPNLNNIDWDIWLISVDKCRAAGNIGYFMLPPFSDNKLSAYNIGTASFIQFSPVTDTDMDGIPNANDNCWNDSNVDQANFDGDPFGDVCDVCKEDVNNQCEQCKNDPSCYTKTKADVVITGISEVPTCVKPGQQFGYKVDFAENSGLYTGQVNYEAMILDKTLAPLISKTDYHNYLMSTMGNVVSIEPCENADKSFITSGHITLGPGDFMSVRPKLTAPSKGSTLSVDYNNDGKVDSNYNGEGEYLLLTGIYTLCAKDGGVGYVNEVGRGGLETKTGETVIGVKTLIISSKCTESQELKCYTNVDCPSNMFCGQKEGLKKWEAPYQVCKLKEGGGDGGVTGACAKPAAVLDTPDNCGISRTQEEWKKLEATGTSPEIFMGACLGSLGAANCNPRGGYIVDCINPSAIGITLKTSIWEYITSKLAGEEFGICVATKEGEEITTQFSLIKWIAKTFGVSEAQAKDYLVIAVLALIAIIILPSLLPKRS